MSYHPVITEKEAQQIIDTNQFKICEHREDYNNGQFGEKAIWKMGLNEFWVEWKRGKNPLQKFECKSILVAVQKYNAITL